MGQFITDRTSRAQNYKGHGRRPVSGVTLRREKVEKRKRKREGRKRREDQPFQP
jgi:hypothetical protein